MTSRSATQPARGSARLPEHDAVAVVGLATRAPSLHNTQPWSFVLDGGALELRADRRRHLPASDPDGRQLLISCGAALFGARLGVRLLGWQAVVDVLPDPGDGDLVARLRPGPATPTTAEEVSLLRAVTLRQSVRSGFATRAVAPGVLAAVRRAAAAERAVLLVLTDPEQRTAVAELTAAADRAQRASREVRRELGTWTSREPRLQDGVPAGAWPRRPPSRARDELPVRDFAGRTGAATRSRRGVPAAAAALVTAGDGPRSWVSAGVALQRVLLTAAAAGVQASLHSQPMGLLGLRTVLRDELPGGGEPQMLLQLGHPVAGDRRRAATPRRPVEQVFTVR